MGVTGIENESKGLFQVVVVSVGEGRTQKKQEWLLGRMSRALLSSHAHGSIAWLLPLDICFKGLAPSPLPPQLKERELGIDFRNQE